MAKQSGESSAVHKSPSRRGRPKSAGGGRSRSESRGRQGKKNSPGKKRSPSKKRSQSKQRTPNHNRASSKKRTQSKSPKSRSRSRGRSKNESLMESTIKPKIQELSKTVDKTIKPKFQELSKKVDDTVHRIMHLRTASNAGATPPRTRSMDVSPLVKAERRILSAERHLAELATRKTRAVRRRMPPWMKVKADRLPYYLLAIAVLVVLLAVAYHKRADIAASFAQMRKRISS